LKLKYGGYSNLTVAAYILIQAELGMSSSVAASLSKVDGVKMAHPVTGVYDVIAFVEVSDLATLSSLVLKEIQTLKGVQRTHTAIAV
jgi:DNA-binding Lrp family transcriptional regulator